MMPFGCGSEDLGEGVPELRFEVELGPETVVELRLEIRVEMEVGWRVGPSVSLTLEKLQGKRWHVLVVVVVVVAMAASP
jgi:hypothetical protein